MVQGTEDSRQKLHASLALLPVDPSQVDYLYNRLLDATPSELAGAAGALKNHQSTLTPKLWTVLESAKPGDVSLLPAASALASYDPDRRQVGGSGRQGGSGVGIGQFRSYSVPGSTPCVPCVTSSRPR